MANLAILGDRNDMAETVADQRAEPETAQARTTGIDWAVLMARTQDGDHGAYRTLLEQMTPYLRSLAARYFEHENDIDDAVQDVLLTVHAIRHAYDPKRPFRPWLSAIANRRIVARVRRLGTSESREITMTEEDAVPAPQLDKIEAAAEHRVLLEAVNQLPKVQRQAIRLLKIEKMSLKEASALTGTTVACLKVSTNRAINNLRKILAKRNDAP